jgi:hypothetical protein
MRKVAFENKIKATARKSKGSKRAALKSIGAGATVAAVQTEASAATTAEADKVVRSMELSNLATARAKTLQLLSSFEALRKA